MQLSANLIRLLSEARLNGYITKYAKRIDSDPIEVYKWNVALSESLYPLLEVVEIGLRNSINIAASEYYNDPKWLLNSNILATKEFVKVENCRSKYHFMHKHEPLIGEIISDLNLGFWVSLLDKRYDNILWHQIIKQTFPYMPRNIRNRKHVSLRFSKIRVLRNRIFHFEPIWHWKDLPQHHDQIIDAVKWINPELLKLVDVDRFYNIYSKCFSENRTEHIKFAKEYAAEEL